MGSWAYALLGAGVALLLCAIGGVALWRRLNGATPGGRPAAGDPLRQAVDALAEGVCVLDGDRRLVDWNRRFADLLGLNASAAQTGMPVNKLLAELEPAPPPPMAMSADGSSPPPAESEAEAGDPLPLDAALSRADGRLRRYAAPDGRCVEVTVHALADGGCVASWHDARAHKRAEDALRLVAERQTLAAEGAYEGVWDWDLESGSVYYGPRWLEMLGLKPGAVRGTSSDWLDRVHPRDIDELRATLDSHIQGDSDRFQAEFRMLHADDDYIWIHAKGTAVRDDAGRAKRLVGSMSDITERKRTEQKLVQEALYDPVTGLPNRSLFLDRVTQVMTRRDGEKQEAGYAVLMLDLDRFKVINDSLGHDVGDELLIDVARRLEGSVRPGESLARLSSDEFAVLLSHAEGEEAVLETVRWLQADLAAAFFLREQEVFTTACVGVALAGPDLTTAEDMLRAADIAMYRAKAQGQGQYAVFDAQMQTRAFTQLQLESDLRRAIERDEIVVYYQPLVDFETGVLAGFETLARWNNPDRGLVPPGEFIPLAEDTGLIVAIGSQLLRKACKRMRAWIDELGPDAPAFISVNLSSRQLQDPNLVRDIELMLTRTGVAGSRLKLEVTESMIMRNPEATARTLMELKELGVTLSIDDFGTGYSSLSYLHRFPFDTLKIDRSFIVSMHEKQGNMEIIRTITLLAHTLGMDVVAEGVEHAVHIKPLRALGCEYAQGFFFARPQDETAANDLLVERKRWDIPAAIESAERAAE